MSFISYAQNFEDVMLWRALKHVGNGTYVDIGAQDPVSDSVSRGFYENGWRGIHVEPVPAYAERLRRNRPDETVLQAALGESEGTLELSIFPDTGLSTAVAAHAQRHSESGREAQKTLVPLMTMKNALSRLAGRDIHWLKIDVEGFEEQVLKGWDSTALRPWIMLIEATVPGSTQTDYEAWEPRVLAAGYRFVYFDGLNRFYVADEHKELIAAFNAPPNVFDDVQLSGLSSWGLYRHVQETQRNLAELVSGSASSLPVEDDTALHGEEVPAILAAYRSLSAERNAMLAERNALLAEREAMRLQHDATRDQHERVTAQLATLAEQAGKLALEHDGVNRRLAEANAQTHEWWSVADRLGSEVRAMHASTSWRITAPLRRFKAIIPRLRALPARVARALVRRATRLARSLVSWAIGKSPAYPRARARIGRLLGRHPALKQRLRQLAGQAGATHAASPGGQAHRPTCTGSTGAADLPKRAARIYDQLRKKSQ